MTQYHFHVPQLDQSAPCGAVHRVLMRPPRRGANEHKLYGGRLLFSEVNVMAIHSICFADRIADLPATHKYV